MRTGALLGRLLSLAAGSASAGALDGLANDMATRLAEGHDLAWRAGG